MVVSKSAGAIDIIRLLKWVCERIKRKLTSIVPSQVDVLNDIRNAQCTRFFGTATITTHLYDLAKPSLKLNRK